MLVSCVLVNEVELFVAIFSQAEHYQKKKRVDERKGAIWETRSSSPSVVSGDGQVYFLPFSMMYNSLLI